MNTVFTALLLEYPPSSRYLKFLFKKIIQILEDKEVEIIDELMEKLLKYLTIAENDGEDVSYTTYFHDLGGLNVNYSDVTSSLSQLPSSVNEVSVHVRSLRNHNHVGVKIWEASLYTAELLLQNPYLIANKSILELGSGVGVTGLLIGMR